MLTLEDKSFHFAKRNWSGSGPNLEVILSYDSDDEARSAFRHFGSSRDVICTWPDPYEDSTPLCRPPHELEHECLIIGPENGSFNLGVWARAFGGESTLGKTRVIVKRRPSLDIQISPTQLKHACDLEYFAALQQPTPRSLQVYCFLLNIVRRIHAKQPFVFARILGEASGFNGSPKHNPCIAVYRKYAEAADSPILALEPNHSRYALVDPRSGR